MDKFGKHLAAARIWTAKEEEATSKGAIAASQAAAEFEAFESAGYREIETALSPYFGKVEHLMLLCKGKDVLQYANHYKKVDHVEREFAVTRRLFFVFKNPMPMPSFWERVTNKKWTDIYGVNISSHNRTFACYAVTWSSDNYHCTNWNFNWSNNTFGEVSGTDEFLAGFAQHFVSRFEAV